LEDLISEIGSNEDLLEVVVVVWWQYCLLFTHLQCGHRLPGLREFRAGEKSQRERKRRE